MSNAIPIGVFARAPEPGRTKTRLAATLGDETAAALHHAFVRDTLAKCVATGNEVTLWCAGDPEHPALVQLAAEAGIRRVPQPSGDLGRRMATALSAGIRASGQGMIVGSDAPTLPSRLLRRAGEALEGAPLVLGPAADGGYYLIGGAATPGSPQPSVAPVFEGVQWSSARVLQQTLERAAAAGLEVARLPPWYDVDTREDFRLLRTHLALDPEAAPATARALRELGLG